MTSDYITTTGETWGIVMSRDISPELAVMSSPDRRILDAGEILAELRALRAQRDELLAKLSKRLDSAIRAAREALGE